MASEPSRRSSVGTGSRTPPWTVASLAAQISDAAFAADTQQYRGERREPIEVRDEIEVVLEGLAEPHTGINPDLFDASGLAPGDRADEKRGTSSTTSS